MRYRLDILCLLWLIVLLAIPGMGRGEENTPETAPPPEQERTLQISLKQAVSLALSANRAIAVARLGPMIQEEKIKEAWSPYDPKLSSSVQTGKTVQPFTSVFANPEIGKEETIEFSAGISKAHTLGTLYELNVDTKSDLTNSRTRGLNPEYDSKLSLKVTQHLLKDFGSEINKSQIVVAQNDKNISEEQFRAQVMDVATQVHQLYWDLVFRIEDLKVKQESLDLAKDLERRVRIQVDVGTLPPIEILQAQSSVASREEDVITAESLIRNTEDQLRQVLNLEDWEIQIVPLDSPKADRVDLDPAQLLEMAKLKRPDYLQVQKEIESGRTNVNFWNNQKKPQLDLVGNLSFQGVSGDAESVFFGGETLVSSFGGPYSDSLDGLANGDFLNWSIGLMVEYPLGNRKAKSNYTSSKLQMEQNQTRLRDLEQTIQLDVRTALREVTTGWKQIQATRVARELAQEKLDAEVKKFEVGESTSFEVLQFQTDLAAERSKEILALANFNQSLAKLDRAVGNSLEANDISISSLLDGSAKPAPGNPDRP